MDETLESVIGQTYSNIEIVLIDDGSTDSSGEKCDLWGKRDGRIRVLHTANNGPGTARNIGINESSGEYIIPVDSDDAIDSRYVEKAVAILEKRQDVGIVYCKADLFGDDEGEWRLPPFSLAEMLICNCVFATAMFRRKDWELAGGYYDGMKWGIEDYDFWLSIIQLGRKVYQIPETLFYYRKREGSRTQLFTSVKEIARKTDEIKYYRHRELYERTYALFYDKQIILYGAGAAGKTYYNFLRAMGKVGDVALWADRNYKRIRKDAPGLCVSDPDGIFDVESYAIVIALNNMEAVNNVKEWMAKNGCAEEKICWYIKETEPC